MASLYSMHIEVNSVGPGYWIHCDTDTPFLMKNIGDSTVYFAVEDRTALNPGEPAGFSVAYPLEPGESITVPAVADASPQVFGFTTRSGNSTLAVLGIK